MTTSVDVMPWIAQEFLLPSMTWLARPSINCLSVTVAYAFHTRPAKGIHGWLCQYRPLHLDEGALIDQALKVLLDLSWQPAPRHEHP